MSTIETIPGAGLTGGDVLQVTGYERIVYPELQTAFDPSKLYRIKGRIKNTVRPADTAKNKIRIGLEGLAVDGETLVDKDGGTSVEGQYFVAAELIDMQTKTLDTWYEFTGYVKGQGTYVPNANAPGAPSGVNAAVALIAPVVWVGCTGGDGAYQIDSVLLDAGGTAVDTAAVNAIPSATVAQVVETDPALVVDHSYAGRAGFFEVSTDYTPAFGYVLGLWPIDGKMYPANIYDTSSNGFMAIDLGLGTGRQKLALPGSIIRDDSLSLITGRDIFLEPRILLGHPTGGAGVITQTEPTSTQMRFIVGKALTATTWHFDPQPVITLREDTPWMARYVYTFSENLNCLIEWNSYLFAGCSNGKIYRSSDFGLTWTNVYSGTGGTTANVNAFAVMGSTLYAVMDKGTDGNCKCVRTTNGTSWTASNIAAETYCYDIMKEAASNLLMACTGNYSGYGKIFTSPDGATWTLRYTSPTESDIIRFAAYSTTYDYAIEGYATAKTLYSTAGTTWAIRNTYTGATSPTDLMGYTEPVNGLKYVCVCIGDTGVIYGGTTTISTAEKTDANIWWENFIIIDGYLYAIGTVGSNYGQLWKRTVVSDGAGGWTISWVKVMDTSNLTAWRFILASNGFIYFVSLMDNSLWRISKRNHVLI